MALPFPIAPNQTDAKSPIDQLLMDSIRLDLEYVDQRATEAVQAAGGNISFKVNGVLSTLDLVGNPASGEKLDGAFITDERVITKANCYIKEQGAGGNFSFDINRRKLVNLGIDRIENLFTANIQQIARASSNLLTQSIERAAPSLLTQSLDFLLPAININSIVNIGGNNYRINLDGTGLLDTALYQVGDYVTLDNTTGNLNDGIFQIVEVNRDNAYNLVLEIVGGANQLAPDGTLRLNAVIYNVLSSVPEEIFKEGETVLMENHDLPSNDGTFTIFKVNYSGNNIVIKKSTVVEPQGTAGGEIKTNRFKYNLLAPVTLEAFEVGEISNFTGHDDVNNNGLFEVTNINYDGNNIVIYNPNGVLQALPNGEIRTYRFIYLLNVDPAGILEVGDSVNITGASNVNNNGTFDIVGLNFNLTDSFLIYNQNGVEQALPAGSVDKTEKVIVLYSDPSTFFLAGQSKAEVLGTIGATNDGTFLVKDINRTGVSQFNLVVDIAGGAPQALPSGQVVSEISSIFIEPILFNLNQDLFTLDLSDKLANYTYSEGTILTLDLLQVPSSSVDFAVNIK